MGFTPLEGLIMGRAPATSTRCCPYSWLSRVACLSMRSRRCSTSSGPAGSLRQSNDLRDLQTRAYKATRRPDSRYRPSATRREVRRRLHGGPDGADAIVFGGGIGECSVEVRANRYASVRWCGLELDASGNGGVSDDDRSSAHRFTGRSARGARRRSVGYRAGRGPDARPRLRVVPPSRSSAAKTTRFSRGRLCLAVNEQRRDGGKR